MDKKTFYAFWMEVYEKGLNKRFDFFTSLRRKNPEFEKFALDYISAEGQNYYHSVILGEN